MAEVPEIDYLYDKYQKLLKYENGIPLNEYKLGEFISLGRYQSQSDCELGALYKWIESSSTICDGFNLCAKELKQVSYDKGTTWEYVLDYADRYVYRIGRVIESLSDKCYDDSRYAVRWYDTGETVCINASNAKIYLKQYSFVEDWGNWIDSDPPEYKYEDIGYTFECARKLKPLILEIDTDDEGYTSVTSSIATTSAVIIQWENGSVELKINTSNIDISQKKYDTPGKKQITIWAGIKSITISDLVKEYKVLLLPDLFNVTVDSYTKTLASITCLDKIVYFPDVTNGNIKSTSTLDFRRCWLLKAFKVDVLSTTVKIDFSESPYLVEPLDIPDVAHDTWYLKIFKGTMNYSNCPSLIRTPILPNSTVPGYDLAYIEVCKINTSFLNCPSLTDVYFGDEVVLGNCSNAFANSNVERAKGIIYCLKNRTSGIYYDVADNMFFNCKNLTDIKLFSISSISSSKMFAECSNLQEHGPVYGSLNMSYMFLNSGITKVELGKIYCLFVPLPGRVNAKSMFEGCLNLTTVEGQLVSSTEGTDYNYFFKGCINLKTIPALFKNSEYIGAGDYSYMFEGCGIEEIPDNFINYNIADGVYAYHPSIDYMFKDNKLLNKVPLSNNVPLWEIPAFYGDGLYIRTYMFKGCPLIANVTPEQWGGILNTTNVKSVSFSGHYAGHTLDLSHSVNGVPTNNYVYVDWGDGVRDAEYTHTYEVSSDPYDTTRTVRIFYNPGNLILDLAMEGSEFDNIRPEIIELNAMDAGMKLPLILEDCTFFGFNSGCSFREGTKFPKYIGKVLSNLLQYSTNLTSAVDMFKGSKVTDIVDAFKYNTNIRDFSGCFAGCSSLRGESPIINGMKLWEIPGAIGVGCFTSATQLTDYDLIPNDWK